MSGDTDQEWEYGRCDQLQGGLPRLFLEAERDLEPNECQYHLMTSFDLVYFVIIEPFRLRQYHL